MPDQSLKGPSVLGFEDHPHGLSVRADCITYAADIRKGLVCSFFDFPAFILFREFRSGGFERKLFYINSFAQQAEEEERSRIDPLKEDLCMLRGLFLDALRKGSSEVQTLRAEPGHLVYHTYDTRDLDFKSASTNLDGIEQITEGVKSILRLSDIYSSDACAANLQAICSVS